PCSFPRVERPVSTRSPRCDTSKPRTARQDLFAAFAAFAFRGGSSSSDTLLEDEPHADLHLAAGAVDSLPRHLPEVRARHVQFRIVPDDGVERVVGLDARLDTVARGERE